MEKEFEALSRIKECWYDDPYTDREDNLTYEDDINTIEQALLELQAIKEAKPSEAMKCLEYIEKKLGGLRYECERTKNHRCDDLFIQEHIFTTIKQSLLKAESCLGARRNSKTLEQMYQLVQYSKPPMKPALWVAKVDGKLEQRVIMEKEEYDKKIKAWEVVKNKCVDIYLLKSVSTLEEYNKNIGLRGIELTQEEFELIKEMVK